MFKKYPIEALFTGPDPAVLHRLADSARRIMEATPEVESITTDWEPQIPVLCIDYEQSSARRMGLGRRNVAISMLSAAGGIPRRHVPRGHSQKYDLSEMRRFERSSVGQPRKRTDFLHVACALDLVRRGDARAVAFGHRQP